VCEGWIYGQVFRSKKAHSQRSILTTIFLLILIHTIKYSQLKRSQHLLFIVSDTLTVRFEKRVVCCHCEEYMIGAAGGRVAACTILVNY
jgi:hypothetical protein